MALSMNNYHSNKGMTVLGAALVSLALSAFASAAPATKEGAKAITDALAPYIGKRLMEKGVISIKPNGDHYDFVYDFSSSKLGLPADGPQFQLGPFTMQLAVKDDNTMSLAFNQPTLDFSYKTGKAGPPFEMEQHLKNCSGSGLFDIKKKALVDQKTTCDSAVVTMRTPLEDIDATLGKAVIVSNSKTADNGDVDFSLTADLQDMVETVALKNPNNPAPPMVMRSDNIHEEASLNGVKSIDLLAALAFFVDRKPNDGSKSGQEEARTKLKAILPLWQNVTAEIRYDNLTVGTPGGIVKIASLDTNVAGSGAIRNGSVASTIAMSGLELPDGLVPDWAKPLVPASATVNLKLTDIDLEAMAGKLIEDVSAPRREAQPGSLQAALLTILTSRNPQLTFDQSLAAPAYDVKGQGQTTLIPSQQGKAKISASSLDAVIAGLGNASVSAPNARQGMMGLTFLKGLAKTGADGRLTWDVDFDSASKTVTVNGQSFGPGAGK